MTNTRSNEVSNLSSAVSETWKRTQRRIAREFRAEHPFIEAGGFVICFEGRATGWTAAIEGRVREYAPNGLAIAADGTIFQAVGGTYAEGAESWEKIADAQAAPEVGGAAPLQAKANDGSGIIAPVSAPSSSGAVTHTPGPWEVRPTRNGDFDIRAAKDPQNQFYCTVECGWGRDGAAVAKANAHLVAASPDLLEACQRIARDFAEGGFDAVTVGAIEDAIAAAKKAEGGGL